MGGQESWSKRGKRYELQVVPIRARFVPSLHSYACLFSATWTLRAAVQNLSTLEWPCEWSLREQRKRLLQRDPSITILPRKNSSSRRPSEQKRCRLPNRHPLTECRASPSSWTSSGSMTRNEDSRRLNLPDGNSRREGSFCAELSQKRQVSRHVVTRATITTAADIASSAQYRCCSLHRFAMDWKVQAKSLVVVVVQSC